MTQQDKIQQAQHNKTMQQKHAQQDTTRHAKARQQHTTTTYIVL